MTMKLRGKHQIGPGMGPEETTGLPVELPPNEAVVPSGVTGDNFAQDGTGFGDVPNSIASSNVGDYVEEAPPASGVAGSVIGGDRNQPHPVPITDEPLIDFRYLVKQQHDILLAFQEVGRALTSVIDRDHPQLVREVPSRKATTAKYIIPNAGQALRLLGADPGRRRAVLILETAAVTVRISSDRQAVENGDGFLLTPLVPITIQTGGEVFAFASAGGVTVSAWVEHGEPWQVPMFGTYDEHDSKSGDKVSRHSQPRGHHRDGGGGGT